MSGWRRFFDLRARQFGMLFVFCTLPSLVQADSKQERPSQAISVEVQKLVKQLSADSFRERVSAQRSLQAYVNSVPLQLAAIVPHIEPEAQLRLVRLFEESFLANDDNKGDNAEKALEFIRDSKSFASADADMILIGNGRLREGRARTQIEKLGGWFAYAVPNERRAPATAPQVGVGFGEPAILQTILISEDWSGTPDDFWHFRRLSHHQNLLLYNIRSNRLKLEDVMALGDSLPGLTVLERGAFLGVRGGPADSSMIVGDIISDSAAEDADLRPRDHIQMVDQHRVRNFAHLVDLLLDYRPGQVVHLKVLRDGEVLDIPVKLSSWKRKPLTDQPIDFTPQRFPGPLGIAQPVPPALPQQIDDERLERLRLE